jgi:hypothetical protein
MGHRYCSGDRVVFHFPAATLPQFAGAFPIERLLPISDDGPNYLIKRVNEAISGSLPNGNLLSELKRSELPANFQIRPA